MPEDPSNPPADLSAARTAGAEKNAPARGDKEPLRFLICGGVNDGKSTLIDRLLQDADVIVEEQIGARDIGILEKDSALFGTQGSTLDQALLADGQEMEHEEGITIDLTYRFFTTDKRKFIVADSPGHRQNIASMVSGASTADLAVILVDARKGIATQIRRQGFIVSLLGARQVILAVNKMDLIDYDAALFKAIRDDYADFAAVFGPGRITSIPISALAGENILSHAQSMPWYEGPSLMTALETADTGDRFRDLPFRLPVRLVTRPNDKFRGYAGTVATGEIAVGAAVAVVPGGSKSQVTEIITPDGPVQTAGRGQAITLKLADELDISAGAIIAASERRPQATDQFQANLIWLHADEMLPGRSYLLKTGNRSIGAIISELRHRINVNSMEHEAAKVLKLNDIGVCNLNLAQAIAFDAYADNPVTGGFILIDRQSNATVAVGMINFGLRRATNIHWQSVAVDQNSRATQKQQRPCILWFTGLSGSGKSTIASILEQKLQNRGKHTYLLDGDNVRHGLNRDLGFTDADRVENIRRIGEVAKMMADAGLVTLVSFISPFRAERRMAREMVTGGEFLEIFVNTPLAVCEERDPKGLYEKARRGEIKNFTGLDSPYEVPENAEINLDTTLLEPEAAADRIIDTLEELGYLSGQ